MKIAQVAPLIESVPPRLYGGTERVVSYLSEELVRQGHDVTVFASGDSVTAAHLVACSRHALRHDARVGDAIPHYMLMLDKLRQRAAEFDILHFHIDPLQYPVFRPLAERTLTTLHGRQDLPDLPAKVDKVDEVYFRDIIAPLLTDADVEYTGEINEAQKTEFLGNARALVFPGDWPEPFGLAMIEAMACGTPVLAFRYGSVPEIVDHGTTGIIVEDVDQAVRALPAVLALDRRAVRQRFEERFSTTRMANAYVDLYRQLAEAAAPSIREGRSINGRRSVHGPDVNGTRLHANRDSATGDGVNS